MKSSLVVAVLAISSFAFAQHGGGRPAGAGAGMGAGASNAGGVGSSASSSHGTSGQAGTSNSGRTPSEILTHDTKLSSNLEKLLPPGTTAQQACDGFKNLGQCVAAIHVAHNLSIPFGDLKSKMTGSGSQSLGKAIGDLRPTVNAKVESKKAQKQANETLKGNS